MKDTKDMFQNVNRSILIRNIKELMVQNHLKQKQLADAIGMSPSNMSKRLSLTDDSNQFTLEQVWLIADYFEVSIDKLLGREQPVKTTTLRDICAFIVGLFESHQVRYEKIHRDEHFIKPSEPYYGAFQTSQQLYPSNKFDMEYNAVYFPNFFYMGDASYPDDQSALIDTIQTDGNDLPSNMKINDFLNKFLEAFERYESREYNDETYQILLDAYYKMLES